MTGVAVNVADAPAHCGFVPDVCEIVTEGATTGLTVTVIPVDVAFDGLAQFAFEIISHVMICPLARFDVVNTGLFVPSFDPFTFH